SDSPSSSFPAGCFTSRLWEKHPCRRAFCATLLVPWGVVRPVDFKAFFRLAAAFLEEVVAVATDVGCRCSSFVWFPLLLTGGVPAITCSGAISGRGACRICCG